MRKILVGIILCGVSLSNCRDNGDDQHQVPDFPVDLQLNLNLPQYGDLNFIGGWVYLNGGSMGIIAYRASQDVFRAYDRHAPYNVIDECRVFVDSTSVTASDECTTSQWLMSDGQVLNGPATNPLREYITTYDGLTLRIYN